VPAATPRRIDPITSLGWWMVTPIAPIASRTVRSRLLSSDEHFCEVGDANHPLSLLPAPSGEQRPRLAVVEVVAVERSVH
jgi:hypothetical protein